MAVKFQDYYETLGVGRSATQPEIQRAYRALARKYHPDVSKEKDAEAKFKQINEAYEVLRDPEKRQRYDQLGANWKPGQDFTPPGYESATGFRPGSGFHYRTSGEPGDFSDFFEMFFGRGTGGGGRGAGGRASGGAASPFADIFEQAARQGRGGRGARPHEGQSIESEITISLEDAYFGGSRQITIQSEDGRMAPRTLNVKIPKGLTDGSTIRLKGQGAPGMGNGGAGDLLLHIHIAPHPRFTVDGRDLIVTLPVTPWEAALGAKVPLATLEGQVTITIPPGTPSGRKLRLRGKGMPGRAGQESGDLLVRPQIEVPKTLTDEERTLFAQLRDASKFDP
jgi:curved DNA-binding protein